MELINKTIVVWFSCGAASAVAAKLTLEKYAESNKVMIVNTPILEEHVDNLRFKKDIAKWLNCEIIEVVSDKFPKSSIVEVFSYKKYMSGVLGAPCTALLKKEARYKLEKSIDIDYHVFGFTFDEIERHNKFVKFERSNVLPILIDNRITKFQCFDILHSAGVNLPYIYSLGFSNANCIGCVKSSSAYYWYLIRRYFPEVFKSRSEQSYDIGCKLVKYKGKRIFLKDLPVYVKKNYIKNWECGLFCDSD